MTARFSSVVSPFSVCNRTSSSITAGYLSLAFNSRDFYTITAAASHNALCIGLNKRPPILQLLSLTSTLSAIRLPCVLDSMNLQRYVPVPILFFPMIPIKYLLLAGYFLWPIVTQVWRHTIYAVHGVCSTEWFWETSVCRLVTPLAHGPDATRYATAIQTGFSSFEGLLSSTSEIVPLVRSLTEAQMSISDLIVLVRSSTLDNRVALAEELAAVATDTKAAMRGLQKFFAQVQGTVDVWVKAVNENLLHLLQHRISPISALSAYCYTVGNSLRLNECAASDLRITQAFEQMLFQFQLALSSLVRQVVQVQGSLDCIESRLEVIRDLAAMESNALAVEHTEVLAALLTSLGLNRQRIEMLESKRRSLQDITRYHAEATQYVTSTLSGLMELEEALEVLWSIARGAGLIDGVPMEVIIRTLMEGVERLHQSGSVIEERISENKRRLEQAMLEHNPGVVTMLTRCL
ncbi:hypothetical protein EDD16DRAFT_1732574 [Pisolithus croceorrhizus]|nr:hypothetical protein EDD16DRAFT_1732574 [Pisolithus croceorrhizus]